MTTSAELLTLLRERIDAGELSVVEVRRALGLEERSAARSLTSRLSTVLYFLGGGVVFLGLIFLVGQQWNELGAVLRVVVTLGSAIAAMTSGMLLDPERRLGAAGSAFFLIAALLLPLGLAVTYDEFNVRLSDTALRLHVAALASVTFLAAFAVRITPAARDSPSNRLRHPPRPQNRSPRKTAEMAAAGPPSRSR